MSYSKSENDHYPVASDEAEYDDTAILLDSQAEEDAFVNGNGEDYGKDEIDKQFKTKSFSPHWVIKPDGGRIAIARTLAVLHIIAAIAYLVYRPMSTIGDAAEIGTGTKAYQIIFYCGEILSLITFFFTILERWAPIERKCVMFNAMQPPLPREQWPSVAIFVCTYNEEVELVKTTSLAACDIDYPEDLLNVYLCDDGRDPEKKEMIKECKRPNLKYITRNNNEHAKAGNINNAMSLTQSDLIVILDADFIPSRLFLQKTLPYYYDYDFDSGVLKFNEKVGFVQTPQYFGNINANEDPFDVRSTFFFEWLIPGRDGLNSTPCIGTNFLASRVAMDSIGGMPTGSVTEDVYMSMLMQAKGYLCYYVKEYLCIGIGPETLSGIFRQRSRWTKGMYQIMFSKDNPLFLKGLTFSQRMSYFAGGWNYGMAFVTLLFMISVPLFLVFHIAPMQLPDYKTFVFVFMPFAITSFMYTFFIQYAGDNVYTSAVSGTIYSQLFNYYIVKAFFVSLYRVEMKFKVTIKSGVDASTREIMENMKKVRYNIFWSLLLVFSIIYGLANPLFFYDNFGYKMKGGDILMSISLAMAFYYLIPNLTGIFMALHRADPVHPIMHWVPVSHLIQSLALMATAIFIFYQGIFVFGEDVWPDYYDSTTTF
eukprot:Nk52_evm15s230 gene=Nk52_evmTU15s230